VPTGTHWAYWVERGIILAALAVTLLGLQRVIVGDNVFSRIATVYSLVHDGTFHIDRPLDQPPNPFEQRTVDKVEIDGRLISTKPPVLPLLMTAQYAALHHGFDFDLNRDDDLKPILQIMTATWVVIPFLMTLVFFALILDWIVPTPALRLFPLAALAFGTQLIGFATVFNNHIPAIGCMMVAVYCALGLIEGRLHQTKPALLAYGLFAGLTFTLDLPVTIFVAVAGLPLLWRYRFQAVLWGGLGLALPIAVHAGTLLWVTGSPLPVQMHPELYLYEAAYWRNPGGVDALSEPKGTYLFHMTFGRFGMFFLFPILTLGLAGALRALLDPDTPYRPHILAAAAALLILFTYYTLQTNNYGGAAYGFRWGMGAMPILLLMAAPFFMTPRPQWKWPILVLLLLVSAYSAYECAQTPWGAHQEWTVRHLYGPSF